MNDQRFGAFVAARREVAGLTQRQLAARMGISNTYVSNIEHGRNTPNERVLWALHHALDLDPFARHALAGRIPHGCVPASYEKALAGSKAYQKATRCGPRCPSEARTSVDRSETEERDDG